MKPHTKRRVAQSVATVGFYHQLVFGVGIQAVYGHAVAVNIMRSECTDVGPGCADKDKAAVGACHVFPYGRHGVVGNMGYADVLRCATGIGHL